MKTTVIAFFSVVGSAAAQAVTSQISPTGSPPPGCTGSYSGHFEVQVRIPSAKRDVPITVSLPLIPELQISSHALFVD